MFYTDLDSNFKKKLSGSISYHLRTCSLADSDEDIVKDFLRYGLNEDKESGTYEYMDKKTFEYIELDSELVKDLVKALKERLEEKRSKVTESKKIDKEVPTKQNGKVIKLFD
ncbi:hypothetical protein OW763_16410 [Clostridium aestuarii]|uniref:Uncharacterized protein n=1 Tax=Clostridium aestuarii TaxID=338193 RepID=A0ABT4D3R8_9CLOT|nr:hypothetical protein [Clostridium aestuarii]MCY6485895.1 hypothetical protein [Clostridium aestuarii]